MSRTRTLSILIAASMLVACGGGDHAAPPGDGTADPTDATAPTAATTEPGTTAPATPVTTPVTTADQSGDPTGTSLADTTPTTTIIIDVTDATPWSVDLSDPVGPLLDTWADRPVVEPTPGEPPADIEARLTWIYEDLIELWRDDLRFVALGMSEAALDRTHRETGPDTVIDILGATASMLGDSYTVIAANSELVAAQGTPQGQLFATWSDHARHWAAVAEMLRSAMAEARNLEPADQVCFLAAINDDDECDGPGAASAAPLLAEVEDRFSAIDEVDLHEPAWYVPSDLEFDECQAWDAAVETTGLTPEEELRMWIGLDDNDLDVNFVSLSECGWQEDGDEDPVGDAEADQATFLAYLTAVAEAIVDSDYDETIDGFAGGAEDERRYYESTSSEATQQILTAARDSGSQLWPTAYDTEFATKLYVVAGIEIDDWVQLDDHVLDWEDLGTRVCDGWTMVIEDYSPDQLTAIDAAVNELGLDGTLIPEGCG
jgi:hypothetical protein